MPRASPVEEGRSVCRQESEQGWRVDAGVQTRWEGVRVGLRG